MELALKQGGIEYETPGDYLHCYCTTGRRYHPACDWEALNIWGLVIDSPPPFFIHKTESVARQSRAEIRRLASGTYKDAVSDTNRKNLLRHIGAGKGLK